MNYMFKRRNGHDDTTRQTRSDDISDTRRCAAGSLLAETTARVTDPQHLCMLTTRRFCVWIVLARQKNTVGKAICHINLKQTRARQWMYPPGTVRDHIEHAIHDLTHNLRFCLTTNADERIQQIEIDPETLQPIAQEVEAKMLAFADKAQPGLTIFPKQAVTQTGSYLWAPCTDILSTARQANTSTPKYTS